MLQGVGPQAQPVMLPDMSSRLVQLEESTAMLMSGAPLPADMQRAHACTKVRLSASANYAHAGLLHVVPVLAFTTHRRSKIAAVCASRLLFSQSMHVPLQQQRYGQTYSAAIPLRHDHRPDPGSLKVSASLCCLRT